MQSAQPFKASQRRFEPSSTAIIKLAQKPLIAADSLVLDCVSSLNMQLVRQMSETVTARNGRRTLASHCRAVSEQLELSGPRQRNGAELRSSSGDAARSRARPFEDRRDAALVVQNGVAFVSSRGAIFTWRKKCISESKCSLDRLGMEMMTFARCGFSGYGYALDPVRRDRGACSLGESQH